MIHTRRAFRARRRTACFVRDLRFSTSSLPHTNGRPLVKLVGVRSYLRWWRFISWSIDTLVCSPAVAVLMERTVSRFPDGNGFSLLHVPLENVAILSFRRHDMGPKPFLHIVARRGVEPGSVGPATLPNISYALHKVTSRIQFEYLLCRTVQLPSSPLALLSACALLVSHRDHIPSPGKPTPTYAVRVNSLH